MVFTFPGSARRFTRSVAMGLFGYAVFIAVVIAVKALPGGENQVVYWEHGLLCAVPFALSEFVVVPAGKKWGGLRRLIVSGGICTAVLFIIAELQRNVATPSGKPSYEATHSPSYFGVLVFSAICTIAFLSFNLLAMWYNRSRH